MIHHTIEHYIQRDILRKLSRTTALSFSKLRPERLESNIFTYHLKQLVQIGLVGKQKQTYFLTVDGLRYVTWVTRTNLDLHRQPKLFCLLIVQNEHGEHIVHRRGAQPFLDRYTFPGGLPFFGEDLQELAQRLLLEKTGLIALVTHRGAASLRLGQNGQLLSHTHAQLFTATVPGRPTLQTKDARFTPEWIRLHGLSQTELLPDVLPLIEKLATTPDYFFTEITCLEMQE